MILEGIVTSLGPQGELNVAPMGPIVDESSGTLVLRPFRTSRTYQNLASRRCGVFHVIDDVLLLARAAIGKLPEAPGHFPAERVAGQVLAAACRWYEFEVVSCDDTQERCRIEARIVHTGRLRDFFGFNRAKHSVLEAAILATRTHLLARETLAAEFQRLRTVVEKTAGPAEREAFDLLERHVAGAFAGEIILTTGSRLHFGLFAHGQPGLREFGGMGVMIERPGFVIRAARNEVDDLHAGEWQSRMQMLLERLRGGPGDVPTVPLRIEIQQAPPPHCGFGSGTQLAMGLARIVSAFAGETNVPAVELARRAGRGARSAIGLHGFEQGGLIVEAGHGVAGEISPCAARATFPEEWRFVLVRPKRQAGISGEEEVASFRRLPPMNVALTDRLCRIALLEVLPAVHERDFQGAATAIGEFGRSVGEYFAPVQGGVFADPAMAHVAERLSKRGLRGIGQTSWGPTIFILCSDEQRAHELAAELTRDADLANCEMTISAPLNRGASLVSRE